MVGRWRRWQRRGRRRYQDPFQPMPSGFVQVPYNDVGALRAAVTARTCAIMLEPVQGGGGGECAVGGLSAGGAGAVR